jgi:hypothetical protein
MTHQLKREGSAMERPKTGISTAMVAIVLLALVVAVAVEAQIRRLEMQYLPSRRNLASPIS